MGSINRNNYESYFLDFLEGNLDDLVKAELMAFLKENPDLAEELEEFEMVQLTPEEQDTSSWSDIKAPALEDLIEEEDLRDQLYFRAMEGMANEHDKTVLAELLKIDDYHKEFETWKALQVSAGSETMPREGLYQLPLELPITDSNYEDFLVAKTEGLLDQEKESALERVASSRPKGDKELVLAGRLKLEAPKGIFYPYKDDLKKKEKRGLVLLYRAAAIILLIGIGGTAMTYILSDQADPQYAQREISVEGPDTLTTEAPQSEEMIEDSIPTKVDSPPLEEWEMIEPDPVFVAESKEESPKEKDPIEIVLPEDLVIKEEFADAEIIDVPEEIKTDELELPEIITPELEEDEYAEELPKTPDQQYKTLPELAEDAVADQFELTDEERDEIAFNLAKKITQKAGEALDSELTREVDEDKDRLTYSLRIRGFKVTHNRAK